MRSIALSLLLINSLLAVDNIKGAELDDLSLEELMNIKIYSATKSYQRIEEIPANITIITRKDIEKYNYTTLDELLKHVPGLFIVDDTEHFQIGSRGSMGSTFKLMINNNPISPTRLPLGGTSNRNFFATPIESIDRIEIIKGPQAVTYGSNSMYGSINIITNDFNEKNTITIGKGNNGQSKVFARINHKNDNGGFTLNTSFYENDGIEGNLKDAFTQDYYNNRDTNAVKSLDGMLENEYKTLDFSHRYKNLTTNITYSNTNYGYYIEPLYDELKVEQEEKAIALTYEDEIGKNLDYKLNYIYSEKDYDANDMPLYNPVYYGGNNHNKDKRHQLDIHLNYNLNDDIKILLGITYEKIDSKFNGLFNVFTGERNYNFTTKDIYTKLQYKPNEKIELNTGLRYVQQDKFNINQHAYHYIYNMTKNTNLISEKENNYLPEISAIYHIDSNNHLKFLYGKAYQLIYYHYNRFEEIESYEINYNYFSKYLQINTSLFYNKSENVTLFIQNGDSNEYLPENEQSVKGLEFSLTYKPNYYFEINPSLTIQDSKSKFIESEKTLDTPFAPNILAKLNMSYLGENTRYSLMLDYIGKMKSLVDTNLERYGKDSKAYLNTTININHKVNKDLSLNLHISNLFDKDIRVPAGSTYTQFYNGMFSEGRKGIFTIKYTF